MDGINLLVSILVCYPELGTVSFEPKDESLRLSFAFKGVPSGSEYEEVRNLLAESILAYHALEGFFGAKTNITLEAQGNTSFLHISRDVHTLSRGEIDLITALIREHFGEILIMELANNESSDIELETAQAEVIDHMIGNLKINRVTDRMIGVREEGRVMVFNK